MKLSGSNGSASHRATSGPSKDSSMNLPTSKAPSIQEASDFIAEAVSSLSLNATSNSPSIISNTSAPARFKAGDLDVSAADSVSREIFSKWASERPRVELIAEWDGYVESIEGNYFTARLRGVRGKDLDLSIGEEEADIPLSDVDPGDLQLLSVGSIFRLTISYETTKSGTKRRFTTVEFRRPPAYSNWQIRQAESRADEFLNGLQVVSNRNGASS